MPEIFYKTHAKFSNKIKNDMVRRIDTITKVISFTKFSKVVICLVVSHKVLTSSFNIRRFSSKYFSYWKICSCIILSYIFFHFGILVYLFLMVGNSLYGLDYLK